MTDRTQVRTAHQTPGRPIPRPITTATTANSDTEEALRRVQGRPARPRRPSALVAAVAAHLSEARPDAVMTEAARMTLALRVAGTPAAARPLLAALPFPEMGITRGEFALRLRKVVWVEEGREELPRVPRPGAHPRAVTAAPRPLLVGEAVLRG